jgi:hypothetical protein
VIILEEFLRKRRRSWTSSEQGGPRATPVDPIYIQKSDKEGVEQQFVEGQAATQKDV